MSRGISNNIKELGMKASHFDFKKTGGQSIPFYSLG